MKIGVIIIGIVFTMLRAQNSEDSTYLSNQSYLIFKLEKEYKVLEQISKGYKKDIDSLVNILNKDSISLPNNYIAQEMEINSLKVELLKNQTKFLREYMMIMVGQIDELQKAINRQKD